MKIIVDGMGGDNAPAEIVKACVSAVEKLNTGIIITGKKDKIEEAFASLSLPKTGIEIEDAADEILMDDEPTSIRHKKDSSMAKGLCFLRDSAGDAFVSAGNSGALLVGSTLFVRCIEGVKRAAFAPVVISAYGKFLLADGGANTECTPEMLRLFADMGSVFMKGMYGIEKPRVGLANNGAEETKGLPMYVEAHKLLKEDKNINFTGNIEGRDMLFGKCDVIVCDGFTGNFILKCSEGASLMVLNAVKEVFKTNLRTKLGAAFVMKELKALKKKVDYKEVGGAVLLGISKPVIKAHGSSDERAFFGALRQAVNFASGDIINEIKTHISAEGEGNGNE